MVAFTGFSVMEPVGVFCVVFVDMGAFFIALSQFFSLSILMEKRNGGFE